MINLNLFARLGLFIYIIFYLIFPKIAITQNTKFDMRKSYATMPEEITGYNNDDPMNSIINTRLHY